MKTFYVTTPLYYINAQPHLGHTYTTLVADCLSRYKRMQGYNVCFLTGTDEHGQNIERAADSQGVSPKFLADQNTEAYRKLWSKFDITYDSFIRTTDDHHYVAAAEVFKRAFDNGFIYKGEYSGWYCIPCNLFAPEAEVAPNCEVCARPTERVVEESYFFRLSDFQDRLLDFYQKKPDFINPSFRRNEVINFVSSGLKDLSVSRTSVRWGIPVPLSGNHVIYVWFDALVGYLSGIGFGDPKRQEEFRTFWPAQVHIVGKDIIRFHSVYWPHFLLAAGLEIPSQVYAHGWWLQDETKMSKSRGNVIDPIQLLDHFGGDAIRYFLLREIPFGADGNFSYDSLIQRVNSDLANDFGNLVSRTLKLVSKSFGNTFPEFTGLVFDAKQKELQNQVGLTIKFYEEHMNKLAFSKALEVIWELLARVNKYITDSTPWKMIDHESQRSHLATILLTSAEIIRIVTVLLSPILPISCAKVWSQLGIQEELSSQQLDKLGWSKIVGGCTLGKIEPAFPRLDKKSIIKKLGDSIGEKDDKKKISSDQAVEISTDSSPVKGSDFSQSSRIAIEDFTKIDLRVGEVVSAEKVKGTDRLLKLLVDLGTENRQIIAGIAQSYREEDLIGKKVVVVFNLQSRKMRDLESNGMLLAASIGEEGNPVLATFLEEVPNGARLK